LGSHAERLLRGVGRPGPQKAHGSPKSLPVAAPGRNSHGWNLLLSDFDRDLVYQAVPMDIEPEVR